MNFGEKEPIQLLDKLRLVCQCRGLFGPSLFRTSGMGCVTARQFTISNVIEYSLLLCSGYEPRQRLLPFYSFFGGDSEMNWGVRKKIHYTFDRNSLISMVGLIFIWNLSLFVFSIAEWSPSLSSAFWYTLVKELFTPVSHVIFIWGHNYPGMGSKRKRLTSQLAKVWRPFRY